MKKDFKKEIENLMKLEGKTKGEVFKTDAEYLLEKEGKEGLKIVQEETKRLGYPIPYERIKGTDWYPIGLRVVSFFAIMNTLNWKEREIEEMGKFAPKISFIVKIFMRTFLSPEVAVKQAPRIWPRHYNVGELKTSEFKEEKKNDNEIEGSCVISIFNFKVHPILCSYLKGYFLGLAEAIVGKKINKRNKMR